MKHPLGWLLNSSAASVVRISSSQNDLFVWHGRCNSDTQRPEMNVKRTRSSRLPRGVPRQIVTTGIQEPGDRTMFRTTFTMLAAVISVGTLAMGTAQAQWGAAPTYSTYPATRSYTVPVTQTTAPRYCPNGNCSIQPANIAACPNGNCRTGYYPAGNCANGNCANGQCAACPNGRCVGGNCPTGCANGQCATRPMNCVNGRCYPTTPTTTYAPAYRSPSTSYVTPSYPAQRSTQQFVPVSPVSYSRNNPFYE